MILKIATPSLCALAILLSSCSTPGNFGRVIGGKGQQAYLFEEYHESRPKAKSVASGIETVDTATSSIADLYGKTIEITDQYIDRTENSQIALGLEKVRKEFGEDAYMKAVLELEGEDKTSYETYLSNQIDGTGAALTYFTKSAQLLAALTDLDDEAKLRAKVLEEDIKKYSKGASGFAKGLLSNPLEAVKDLADASKEGKGAELKNDLAHAKAEYKRVKDSISGIKLATNQGDYSKKALEFLLATRKAHQSALNNKGW